MSLRSVRVVALVVAVSAAAFCRNAGNAGVPVPDLIWEPAPTRQDDFDGVPLPESSDVPTATQITPAIVNIGQRYGVPQSSGKKKQSHVKKDDFAVSDHVVHGGTLLYGTAATSLGALALLAIAGKALLLALAAIAITCLGASVPAPAPAASGTVYEVIARPQYALDHSYSSEVRYEPYRPVTLADLGYGSYVSA